MTKSAIHHLKISNHLRLQNVQDTTQLLNFFLQVWEVNSSFYLLWYPNIIRPFICQTIILHACRRIQQQDFNIPTFLTDFKKVLFSTVCRSGGSTIIYCIKSVFSYFSLLIVLFKVGLTFSPVFLIQFVSVAAIYFQFSNCNVYNYFF